MHAVKPLPFDASKLRGLSERLIVSHHENNYGGAVKNLNRGAAAAKYVDAFFQNINWGEVNRRFERARRKSA